MLTESLNATDEYFSNFTDTVSEAEESINQDMATVQDIQQNQSVWMAVQFAGMFTILVILVSGYHVSQHLRHMHLPVVQRKIMAVLWMTPIYAISSWLSLVFVNAEPYLAVVREFYESYCVYMFLSFLIAVLGRGDRRAVVTMLELKADELSKPDACCCGPSSCNRCWFSFYRSSNIFRKQRNDVSKSDTAASSGQKMTMNPTPPPGTSRDEYGNYITADRMKAEAVLDQCQMYAMQFVLLRPVTAIGWLVSNQLVEPKKFLDPTTPQLYIAIVTNISIFFAFRGLVRFYHATRSNLEWCNPWPKFLCIKGVVFMTFWQKMVLGLVVNLGYSDKFDSQEAASEFVVQAQNFLICLEMLFSAVAHCFVFTPDEWADGYREREEQRQGRATPHSFGDSVALSDFISDVKIVMTSKKRRRQLKKMQKRGISPALSWDDETGDLNLSRSSRSSGGESEDGDDYQRNSINMTQSDETGDSVDCEGSLARIERFIDEHTIDSKDRNEVV